MNPFIRTDFLSWKNNCISGVSYSKRYAKFYVLVFHAKEKNLKIDSNQLQRFHVLYGDFGKKSEGVFFNKWTVLVPDDTGVFQAVTLTPPEFLKVKQLIEKEGVIRNNKYHIPADKIKDIGVWSI